ncbi:hypothetical protein [Microlunatus sp. Gsoil 973]|uniref:hypothetical protein n=1 Tax=Microlunatus sp. Gsoil 973 TaxID=2672569 RepID=UPI001E504EB0|nr:hypothetical protein [Microlunatus sp. Gsoil 973]
MPSPTELSSSSLCRVIEASSRVLLCTRRSKARRSSSLSVISSNCRATTAATSSNQIAPTHGLMSAGVLIRALVTAATNSSPKVITVSPSGGASLTRAGESEVLIRPGSRAAKAISE